jgi:hypothetical protein
MGNKKQWPGNTWDEDDEIEETSGPFRDDYAGGTRDTSSNPRTPYARESDTGAPGAKRPHGGTGGGRIYEEGDDRPTRPRPTRQSREEVYSRYRQRPRQPVYSRQPPDEYGSKPPASSSGRTRPPQPSQQSSVPRRSSQSSASYQEPTQRRAAREDYGQPPARRDRYDDYDEQDNAYSAEDEYEPPRQPDRSAQAERRRRLAELPDPEPPHKRRRGRGIFSTIMIGCLGGIITLAVVVGLMAFLILHNTSLGTTLNIGKSPYHLSVSQPLNLGDATQLIVQNQVGNVSIQVSSSATSASINSVKTVEASSQSDANQQFKQITLTASSVSQTSNAACLASSCLLVSVTLPGGQNAGVLGSGSSDSVNLTITLPPAFTQLSQAGAPSTITASTTSGTISVDKFNGVLDLTGNNGTVNINVTNSLVFAGTCLQTTNGNVTIGQQSFFDLSVPSTLVPCSNTTSQSTHPWYSIKTGIGNLHISLDTQIDNSQLNMLLDANTNRGKVTDAFGVSIPTASDGSATYHGPLTPGVNPTASLYVETSTGKIQIDKG